MTDLNTKILQLIARKRQDTSHKSESAKSDNLQEDIGKDILALRQLIELKKENPKCITKDLSDEELLAIMEPDKKPSLLDKIKQSIIKEDVQETGCLNGVENIQNEVPEIKLTTENSSTDINLSPSTDYNVRIKSENGTDLLYTIKTSANCEKAANIIFDNKNERLVIKGDNIEVVTKNQYNNVMILGNSNKITVGSSGITYVSNANIYYNSEKSGSAISKWGNPKSSTTESAPTASSNANTLTLTRGSDAVQLGTTENTKILTKNKPLELTLVNPFTGTNYKYTISLTDKTPDGTGVPIYVCPKIEFLSNGRLVITGDYLDITSAEGQEDDIILIGKYNTVNTGDMDDKVRVGNVVDGNSEFNGPNIKYNTINTGSGNDMVTVRGLNKGINMGNDGNDTCMGDLSTDLENVIGANITRLRFDNIDGEVPDNHDGWAVQSSDGGICGTLSIINSLCSNPSKNGLENIVKIEKNDDGYSVTFKANNKSIQITNKEINDNNMLYGDIDSRIFVVAFEKILKTNYSYLSATVGNRSWLEYFYNEQPKIYSEYITGNAKYYNTHPNLNLFSKTQLLNLWQHYTSGEISNWIVGFDDTDGKIGKIGAHAYSVQNVTEEYIELVNPWDDRDCVRYSLDEFLNMGYKCRFYGYSQTEITNFANTAVDYQNANSLSVIAEQYPQTNTTYNPFNTNNEELNKELEEVQTSINNIKSMIFNVKLHSKQI